MRPVSRGVATVSDTHFCLPTRQALPYGKCRNSQALPCSRKSQNIARRFPTSSQYHQGSDHAALGLSTMKMEQGGSIRRDLGRLFDGQSIVGLDEVQLLDRFVDRRDERAFAALVSRHGPMVLGVCRRLLADPLDVEDAFQATFLIFVRRAGSIRSRDRLATWLFGVARKVAQRARTDVARRKARETSGVEFVAIVSDRVDRELNQALFEEIDRLPDSLRLPVLLCCVEGLSYDEAASQLKSTAPAVRGRLARGRERLRDRLARRGFAPTAVGVVGGLLAGGTVRAAVPVKLLQMTTQLFRAGTFPVSLEILVEGVIPTMIVTKTKILAAALLACGVAGSSVGVYAQRQGEDQPTQVAVSDLSPAPAQFASSAETAQVKGSSVLEFTQDGGKSWFRGPFVPSVPVAYDEYSADDGETWSREIDNQENPKEQLFRGLSSNGQVVFTSRRVAERAPDDDLMRLEKKLDRVLDALERNSGRPSPRDSARRVATPVVPATPLLNGEYERPLPPAQIAAPAEPEIPQPPIPPVPPMELRDDEAPARIIRDPAGRPVGTQHPRAARGVDGRPFNNAQASRSDDSSDDRINALEQKIARLEARIAALEQQQVTSPDVVVPPPGVSRPTRDAPVQRRGTQRVPAPTRSRIDPPTLPDQIDAGSEDAGEPLFGGPASASPDGPK